jgi:ABC-type dipeptide/oligopeptide/nickel transport system permease subunit
MIRVLTAVVVALILLSPLAAPYDPMLTEPINQLQPPDTAHLLGTDLLGRDVLSRAMFGGQRTLLIATAAAVVALVPGVLLGLTSGLGPEWLDGALQTLIGAALALPGLLLALVILTLLGTGALPLSLATGISQIAAIARVTRSAVMEVRSLLYVQAAASLGVSRTRLVLRHILPNIAPTLLAYAVIVFSFSVLNNAALSFLGLGGDPGIPDWGMMLADARTAFRSAPWIGLAPGLGITLLVMLLNRLARSFSSFTER